jgi:hypothetical protein
MNHTRNDTKRRAELVRFLFQTVAKVSHKAHQQEEMHTLSPIRSSAPITKKPDTDTGEAYLILVQKTTHDRAHRGFERRGQIIRCVMT